MTTNHPEHDGIGPAMVDDDGNVFHADEETVRSALGATGAALIAMIATDASAHDWVTLNPHAMPIYLAPTLRFIIRWTGYAIALAILVTAWREARERDRQGRAELNGRAFIQGRRPGGDA